MRTLTWEDKEELVDGTDRLQEFLSKGEIKTVEIHKPGSIITLAGSGRQYQVQDNGSWRRMEADNDKG